MKAHVDQLEAKHKHTLDRQQFEHKRALQEQQIELEQKQRDVDNQINSASLQAQLIDRLPQIAKSLPKADVLKIYEGGQGKQLTHLLESLLETMGRIDQSN